VRPAVLADPLILHEWFFFFGGGCFWWVRLIGFARLSRPCITHSFHPRNMPEGIDKLGRVGAYFVVCDIEEGGLADGIACEVHRTAPGLHLPAHLAYCPRGIFPDDHPLTSVRSDATQVTPHMGLIAILF